MKKLISLMLLLSLVLTACNKAEPTTPEESDITEETTAEEETLGDFQAELEDITHSFKTFLGLEESEYVYETLY